MRLATLALLLTSLTAAASAQVGSRTAVYADALGPGGVYSVGAEVPLRSLGSGQLVGRLGISAAEGIGGNVENALVTIPATLAYVQPVLGALSAEAGIGLTALAGGGFAPGATESTRRVGVLPHLSASARLDLGRVALRLGATAFADPGNPNGAVYVQPVLGVGFGL